MSKFNYYSSIQIHLFLSFKFSEIIFLFYFSEAFEMTIKVFNRLDIVINNAGVMNDRFWELEVDVNLVGSFITFIFFNK